MVPFKGEKRMLFVAHLMHKCKKGENTIIQTIGDHPPNFEKIFASLLGPGLGLAPYSPKERASLFLLHFY